MSRKPSVYLASPLGFATSTRDFLSEIVRALGDALEINNPWDDHRFDDDFVKIAKLESYQERFDRLHAINHQLGQGNEERIRDCDALIAVLDGVDVDSGTAAEIGFAYALGMRIYGIRTDFRLAGDNLGSIVNLQVQYFIEQSGGRVVETVPDILKCAMEFARQHAEAS